MTVKVSRFNLASILRYAWIRARAAAAVAGDKIRVHFGPALRAAWCEAKAALDGPALTPRQALVSGISRHDAAMIRVQAVIQSTSDREHAGIDVAVLHEYRSTCLDSMRAHGIVLRSALQRLDDAAAKLQADGGPRAEAGQLHFFEPRSDYVIRLAGEVICITDLTTGARSVVDDVENIIHDLGEAGHNLFKRPIIYHCDGGEWSEIALKNGMFSGFRALDDNRQKVLRDIAFSAGKPNVPGKPKITKKSSKPLYVQETLF
ncbi:hypothetical protein [Methylobacterium frigidaeris]|uniref:Uncharacterized protein n=1 Tax=Methylobacterium frigidaeris TaxID=2038277 RepID=A0AA37M8Q2_9HYPH|nr:hypothetical protein [Methylobacterium frigidaeris]GJD66459.1 hypothetical protein MPEAHAMD_6657 [Methylobacterium frigidaeris]